MFLIFYVDLKHVTACLSCLKSYHNRNAQLVANVNSAIIQISLLGEKRQSTFFAAFLCMFMSHPVWCLSFRQWKEESQRHALRRGSSSLETLKLTTTRCGMSIISSFIVHSQNTTIGSRRSSEFPLILRDCDHGAIYSCIKKRSDFVRHATLGLDLSGWFVRQFVFPLCSMNDLHQFI